MKIVRFTEDGFKLQHVQTSDCWGGGGDTTWSIIFPTAVQKDALSFSVEYFWTVGELGTSYTLDDRTPEIPKVFETIQVFVVVFPVYACDICQVLLIPVVC